MRSILLVILTCSLMQTSAQQRIFLYSSPESILHKGFDTIAPFMDYYPAKEGRKGKTAVLICPGGSYTHLAWDKEGTVPAHFFNEHGIDAFVLRYRLNNDRQEGHHFPAQYNDVITALRIIRSRSAEWNIDADKTGVMGFSAGGHLASTAGTIIKEGDPTAKDPLERISTRPSFLILLYPVITMEEPYVHRKSREMITGSEHPDEAIRNSLSTDTRVTVQTPPTFLVHADNDAAVPPENSVLFYQALKKHKIPASLMIYDHGGHGFGTAPADTMLHRWPDLCIEWMASLGFK